MNGVNYYQLFSLTPDASIDDLKAQYRKLSLTHHPDRGGSHERMAELNEAYRVLSNPLLKSEYDHKWTAAQAATSDGYHYTQPRPRPQPAYAQAAPVERPQNYFWRWFGVLALLGLALVVYDVMTTWVMPHYITELPSDAASATMTPSGDLTDEAASALSEFQGTVQTPDPRLRFRQTP